MVHVTTFYAGILVFISIVLAFLAGSGRGQAGVSLGDGGNMKLLAAVRRHANFTEYVPMILIAMILIEINGAPKLWLHLVGGGLVLARIAHPIGLRSDSMTHPLRFVGAMLTALITVACGGILIWQAAALMGK